MNRIIFFFFILILTLGVIAWTLIFLMNRDTPSFTKTTPQNLEALIEKVGPATVSIEWTSGNGTVITTLDGTGIIVDSRGIILTSKHLVSEWFTYTIEFQDGTKMPAKFLKSHPTLDLALLSIISDKTLSLPVGNFINSQATTHRWESVITIGNMLGLYPGSVSEGIISGLNRTVSFGGISMTWLIQTTIPMSLWNSGGPLIDSDGKIIGINAGIVGGSSQIGWTLPLTQEEVDSFIK